ncbi:hypothetical protein DRN86_01540, partial [Candidatus Geothermarchaeota archaeon]
IKELSTELCEWLGRKWFICSHYDADGLSSAGILAKLLLKSKSSFVCRILTNLTTEDVRAVSSVKSDVYVFLDLGSSEITSIRNYIKGKVFVIDHHQIPTVIGEPKGISVLSPELLGLNGGEVGCTSVLSGLLAYFAFKDPYYLKLGLVGAVGDLQNGPKNSVNDYLIRAGIKEGVVSRYKTFTFFKLIDSPIHKGICWNFDPYIPGLTGEEDVVISLLTSANIRLKEGDRWRKIKELSEEEKSRIVEKIIEFITRSKSITVKTSDFLRTVHEFKDERDEMLLTAENFSSLLNACGRMNREDLAIAISIGFRDRKLLEKARKVMEERRMMIKEQIKALRGREREHDGILIIDGRGVVKERFTGSLATIYSLSPALKDKIVVVMTESSKEELKISARTSKTVTSKGLNLGRILNKLARIYGGVGGGHAVAAGATIKLRGRDYERTKREIIDVIIKEMKRVEGKS